jgi:hypothetical protein
MGFEQEGIKSPLYSKTVHFNTVSSVLIPAIWPFLPEHFRNQEYSIAAVTAWFAIGNIILRFLTKRAVGFVLWGKHEKKTEVHQVSAK